MREKNKAVPVKDILENILEKQKPAEESLTSRIINNWENIVTKKGARFCRPVAIKNKVLVVNVSNSAWLHQLTLNKSLILENIKNEAGAQKIIDLRFKIGN